MTEQAMHNIIEVHWPAASAFFAPLINIQSYPLWCTIYGINHSVRVREYGSLFEFVEDGVWHGHQPAEFLACTKFGAEMDALERSVDNYIRTRRVTPPQHPLDIYFAKTWPLFYSCFDFTMHCIDNICAIHVIGFSELKCVYISGRPNNCSRLDDAERFIASRLLCFEIEKILPQPIAEEVTAQIDPGAVLLNFQVDSGREDTPRL